MSHIRHTVFESFDRRLSPTQSEFFRASFIEQALELLSEDDFIHLMNKAYQVACNAQRVEIAGFCPHHPKQVIGFQEHNSECPLCKAEL